MNYPSPAAEEYSIYCFSIVPGDTNAVHVAELRGTYSCVIKAFDEARLLALREWERITVALDSRPATIVNAEPCEVVDTEFGYILKCGDVEMSQIWIYAKEIQEALG